MELVLSRDRTRASLASDSMRCASAEASDLKARGRSLFRFRRTSYTVRFAGFDLLRANHVSLTHRRQVLFGKRLIAQDGSLWRASWRTLLLGLALVLGLFVVDIHAQTSAPPAQREGTSQPAPATTDKGAVPQAPAPEVRGQRPPAAQQSPNVTIGPRTSRLTDRSKGHPRKWGGRGSSRPGLTQHHGLQP